MQIRTLEFKFNRTQGKEKKFERKIKKARTFGGGFLTEDVHGTS